MSQRLNLIFNLIIILYAINLYSQNIVSEKWYGDSYNDLGYEAVNTQDGGFLIAGVYNYGYYNDIYLIRTDSNGDTLWTKKYGGSSWDNGYSIATTFNNNFIIGGRKFFTSSATSGDAYLLNLDSDGNFVWDANYGSSQKDGCNSIIQTSDSGFVFTGQYNYNDIWVLKTDSAGTEKWSKTYGVGGGNEIIETEDHNFLITGILGTPNDMYIAKLNSSNGDTIWTRVLGGNLMDRGYAICNSFNGGFLIVGLTESFGAGGYDIYLAELTSDGDTLSTVTYGFAGNETGYSICQTPDSCYLIAASTNSIGNGLNDVYVLKIDVNLDTVWTETYGGTKNDYPEDILCSKDSAYVVIGTTESFGVSNDVYFLKIEENDLTGLDASQQNTGNITNSYSLSQNYPNPFNPETTIRYSLSNSTDVELAVYNVLGHQVASLVKGRQAAGSHTVKFDGSRLTSGLYFYKLNSGEFSVTKKMLLVK